MSNSIKSLTERAWIHALGFNSLYPWRLSTLRIHSKGKKKLRFLFTNF